MKTCMLALSLVAILGFTGIADAKGQGHGGYRGKIASVTAASDTGAGSFTISMHSKKNASTGSSTTTGTSTATPKTLTIQYTSSTSITINGAAGKIDSSLVGKHVRVVGTLSGNTITATQIIVTEGHHKKPAA